MKKVFPLGPTAGLALLVVAGPAWAQSTRALRVANGNATRTAGVLVLADAADPGDSLYRAARNAMSAGTYRRAAAMFKEFADRYPTSKTLADALYWRGYSLYQLGNADRSAADYADALAALDLYDRAAGKNAALVGDAADLRTRVQTAQARLGDAAAAGAVSTSARGLAQPGGCSGSSVDEETRMAALEGLLNMNSDDAIPILEQVLKRRDACRTDLRKKAVWLISQKQSPTVVNTLLDVARNDPSPDVRSDAVFWLSQIHSDKIVPMLDSILFSSTDEAIRKKAIFSLSQQMDDPRAAQALRRAVEDERLPVDIRGEAIFWLGNSPNVANLAYLESTFRKTTDANLRSRIIQSVANTPTPEAGAWLLDVARDKAYDIETRKNAIFWASQRKSIDLQTISNIFAQSKGDPEMQKQVLFIYSQRSEPAAVDDLMAIARSDPDIKVRKQALFWLGQKNDPRVKKFILDLVNTP